MALALGKLTTGTPKFRGSGSLSACTIDKHTWSSVRTVRLLAKNTISLVNSYQPIFSYNTTYPHGDAVSVYNLNDSVRWKPERDLENQFRTR